MADQITNYQCPNCSGPLRFAGDSGQLQCDSCGTSFEVPVVEQLYADKEQTAAVAGAEPQWDTNMAGSVWSDEETAHLRAYSCPSCGADLIFDDTTVATSCPYCDNPTVVPAQVTGSLRPDYVIPFRLDKNAAINALKNYYKGKKFLPSTFAAGNHIEEIKGVYVPFWLYNGETDAAMRFRGTVVTRHRHGNYEVTTTDHYRVTREGSVAFEKVPVDGSSKMPDTHMDAIEPYNYGELAPFSTAYLPGFLADKYDEDADVCSKRANERIVSSTERAFASTTKGYSTLVREYSNIVLKKGDVKYALMPVWMLASKWEGKDFLFAMNGQTGKLIGDLPVDKGKFFAWFGMLAGIMAAALGLVLFVGM